MLIVERIRSDLNAARKERGNVGLYSTLLAEVERVGKDKGNLVTTDEQAVAVIKKFVANTGEVIVLCRTGTGGSISKLREAEHELVIYDSYLPKQLTEQEINSEVCLFLLVNPTGKMPQIMKYFKEKFSGKYDGKILSTIAKELTS